MPEHKVGSQEDFDAAREELLAEEKELTDAATSSLGSGGSSPGCRSRTTTASRPRRERSRWPSSSTVARSCSSTTSCSARPTRRAVRSAPRSPTRSIRARSRAGHGLLRLARPDADGSRRGRRSALLAASARRVRGRRLELNSALEEQHESYAAAGGLLLRPANADDSFSHRSPTGSQVELTDARPRFPAVTSV